MNTQNMSPQRTDGARTPETIAVVGLGYVGLPVAALARHKGFSVLGYDIDAERVAQLSAGTFSFHDAAVEDLFRASPLDATTDAQRLRTADVVIVAVPTPITSDAQPDLTALRAAVETAARHTKPGVVLSVESTVNPGVCEEVLVPLLRSVGRDPSNDDLFLVHCPERVNPGDARWPLAKIPRVLGGYTAAAADRGSNFYTRLLDAPVQRMSSLRVAEAVKVVENAFRDVNIAFVNELAQSFDRLHIDLVEVIQGASSKPFAFLAHYPGCGVGGHCIPIVPHHLIAAAADHGFDHRFLKLARDINKSMPAYAVEKLKQVLGEATGNSTPLQLRGAGRKPHFAGASRGGQGTGLRGVRVALLGLAYKRDMNDLRESPAVDIERILRAEGAEVLSFDPFVPERSSVPSLPEALKRAEAVLLATDHTVFCQLTPKDLSGTPVRAIVDGKNCLDHAAFRAAGYSITGIGH
ncbi:MAG: UDP-glucose 6-dehydrogenase [Parcubacteria group bacterium Gr01-1014_106]|nr:MAG: UDP-glucose 6-dehydrogenase [Parcubacteria group bacterium Gr01-1014_106]